MKQFQYEMISQDCKTEQNIKSNKRQLNNMWLTTMNCPRICLNIMTEMLPDA